MAFFPLAVSGHGLRISRIFQMLLMYVCVLWWCMVCVVRLFVLVSSFRVYLPLGRVGFNKVCVCMCVIGGDW